jgi:hypothetical protein
MTCAPIALFVYNRPWHVRQAVATLQKNALSKKSDLYIFSDAAANEAAQSGVKETREFIKSISGFNSVKIVIRESNFGLEKTMINGITDILAERESIIVLEEDLVCSPFFLDYMNRALEFYKNEDRVISIHGYVYPVSSSLPETYFLRGADCWGWGTWRRGWQIFEQDGNCLLEELKTRGLERQFDINGSYPYTRMLKKHVAGKNNSWAIRWYASAFLKDKLTLYPGYSLIRNIGNDGSGTHCAPSRYFDGKLHNSAVSIGGIPIEENTAALKEFEKYFKSIANRRVVSSIRKLLKF